MKPFHPSSQRGSAFISTVMFCAILLLLTASVLRYSGNERKLNNRAKLMMEARLGAEAVSEYGVAQVKKLLEANRTFTDSTWQASDGLLFTSGSLKNEVVTPLAGTWDGSKIMTSTGYSPKLFVGSITASNGLQFIDPTNPDNASDPLKGKKVFLYTLDILSSATAQDTSTGAKLTKYWTQKFAIRAVPLFSNAVYFNMDLEISPGPDMTITGSTHTNQRIFPRSANSGTLTFAGPVTAVRGIWTKHMNGMPYMEHTQDTGVVEQCNGAATTLIYPAGATAGKAMKITTNTTGFSPNLTAGSGWWVESTWERLPGSETWQQHIGETGTNPDTFTETTDTKENFADWIQQTFKGNLLSNVNGLTPIRLQGIPDYSYTFGSAYPDPLLGSTDDAYTYVSGGNDLNNAAHGLIEPAHKNGVSGNYVDAIEVIKYARAAGLYIVANTTLNDATGHQPDGTEIQVKAKSYRAFMNNTNTTPATITEVLLPGQDTYGNNNATPNPYTTHKNARPVVQMMNIDFSTNQETTTQRRMVDMRRTGALDADLATSNTTFSHVLGTRDTSNKYVPKNLYMIDIDMNELKKAVKTISTGTGTTTTGAAEYYATGAPSSSTFTNYIYAANPTKITAQLTDDTRIVVAPATSTTPLANAFTTGATGTWNGAIYIESIAAETTDRSGDYTASSVTARKARMHNRRNSGVRLLNGRGQVPSVDADQGLTVATNDVLYILGHYNADGLASTPATLNVTNAPLGSSNGHYYETGEVPASVVADAVVLLSQPVYAAYNIQTNGWNDALSGYVCSYASSTYSSNWATTNPSTSNRHEGLTSPAIGVFKCPYDSESGPLALMNRDDDSDDDATSRTKKFKPQFTEYATAILCGMVPSGKNGTGQSCGGLHNFPRFLENWSSVDCRIRGSFVALFECRVGTEPWNLRTYGAPGRVWGFNLLYDTGKMPPLTPKSIHFRRIGANDMTKADFDTKATSWGYTP